MHSEQRKCRKGRCANGTFSHRADIRERLSPALAEGTFLAYSSAWLLEDPKICVNFCLQVMKHPKSCLIITSRCQSSYVEELPVIALGNIYIFAF